jgi:hypothetical protein
MKYAPVLLLTIFNAMAYAQPIYRCEDSSGRIAFQDRACTEMPGDSADRSGSVEQFPGAALDRTVRQDARDYEQGDWSYQQHRARRLQVKLEAPAQLLQMRALLKPSNDRKAAEHADNRRRCQSALQVAALCGGTSAGKFYCDEKGFHATSIIEVSTLPRPATSNGSAYRMQQCAQQAAKRG